MEVPGDPMNFSNSEDLGRDRMRLMGKSATLAWQFLTLGILGMIHVQCIIKYQDLPTGGFRSFWAPVVTRKDLLEGLGIYTLNLRWLLFSAS